MWFKAKVKPWAMLEVKGALYTIALASDHNKRGHVSLHIKIPMKLLYIPNLTKLSFNSLAWLWVAINESY
jgi:hypothetical protein